MAEIIVLLVLGALAVGAFLLVKQRREASGVSKEQRAELRASKRELREAENSHSTAIRSAKRELRKAENSHSAAIRSAEQSVKKAQKVHKQQVDAAQAHLEQLQESRGKKLASYRKHTVFEHAIVTPSGEANLAGVHAVVDTAGNLTTKSRSTLTRMAAGGVLLGPLGAVLSMGLKKNKEVDKRELYLLVDAVEAPSVIQCPPDEGLKAREFATKVNAAAAAETAYRQQLPGLLDQARQQLEAAKDATGPIGSAKAELDRVSNDPLALATIEGAQQELAAIERALPTGEQPALPPGPPGGTPPTSPPPSNPPSG